jgi:protein O-GlcNAc transferase
MKPQRSHAANEIEAALQHHRAGRLKQAEAIYQKMPHNPDALHLRGVIAYQSGRHGEAAELIGKAIRAQPANAAYCASIDPVYRTLNRLDDLIACYQKLLERKPHDANTCNNLANALKDQNRLDEAADCYRKAISQKPDFAEAHSNLGTVLAVLGRFDQAMAHYRQALALKPDFAECHTNLGIALQDQGNAEEAVACFRKAVSLKPQFVEAYAHMGSALLAQGKPGESIACYQQAIALRPGYADAYYNLGTAFQALGRRDEAASAYQHAISLQPYFAEAYNNLALIEGLRGNTAESIDCYRQAVALKPDYTEAHNNLGIALKNLGQLDEAADCYRTAIALRPDFAEAHNNMGSLLSQQGNQDQAVDHFQRALTLKPDLASAHSNMGFEFLAQGKTEEAIACYRNAIAHDPDLADAHSSLIFAMLYSPLQTADAVFAENLRFRAQFEAPHQSSWPAHDNLRDKDKRLKVGYVSGDFRAHPIAFFFEPVVAGHDRSQVEVFCYHNHHQHDEVTKQLAALSDHWIACKGMADEALAQRIRADGIDILVDLSGHTAHNRLPVFARKPAPIQVTWMGSPATTGLTAMDYRLTDAALDPPGLTEGHHSEALLCLPAAAQFKPAAARPPINALPALTQDAFTFACLNNLAKISEQSVALWAEILRALPQARLMLGNANHATKQRLTDLFARYGIAEQRLVMHPRMSLDDYLALHHQIDLALDPFPFNGGTTSFHALSMGVPVVTLAGDTPVTRSGASIMANVGLPEFVATSPEEYVRLAIAFAGDLPRLDRIRQSLGAGNPALYESGTNHFARRLEQAFRQVWATWCDVGSGRATQDIFETAMTHHVAGRLAEAEDLYLQILRIRPDHPDALHLLGVMAHQHGDLDRASELIGAAIASQPSAAKFDDLALVAQARGDLDEAIRIFRHALSLNPDQAGTYRNLGVALQTQGKLPEAMECFIQAISRKSDDSGAYCNLGVVAYQLGHLNDAIECFQKALSIDPDHAQAHDNLEHALRDRGVQVEAARQ